jgi:hypothetical protein
MPARDIAVAVLLVLPVLPPEARGQESTQQQKEAAPQEGTCVPPGKPSNPLVITSLPLDERYAPEPEPGQPEQDLDFETLSRMQRIRVTLSQRPYRDFCSPSDLEYCTGPVVKLKRGLLDDNGPYFGDGKPGGLRPRRLPLLRGAVFRRAGAMRTGAQGFLGMKAHYAERRAAPSACARL